MLAVHTQTTNKTHYRTLSLLSLKVPHFTVAHTSPAGSVTVTTSALKLEYTHNASGGSGGNGHTCDAQKVGTASHGRLYECVRPRVSTQRDPPAHAYLFVYTGVVATNVLSLHLPILN